MNYPDDFNTRTFPAGKSVAVSRVMGIGIMSAFFVILCLCGLLIWTIRSTRVEPYILATDGINDQWRIIMARNETPTMHMTDAQLFQQSLVWRFTQDWFSISPNRARNIARWNTECKREYCISDDADTKNCSIYCSSGDDLFYRFSTNVLPQYQAYATAGATWLPVSESMRIDPIGNVSEHGGAWRIQMTILTDGGNGAMDIIAYAKVARNNKYYPAHRGYYVADFNAYRVSQ